MAGIYVHIPFCRKACHYCNFHFSTSFKQKDDLVEALLAEIVLRAHYLGHQKIDTIYFGGGTPSALPPGDILKIMDALRMNHSIRLAAEITLEANPEDIHQDNLQAWKQAGINRLSIGIQAFQDDLLQDWNRAHDATQAKDSISLSQKEGFENITADLIYGGPGLSNEEWISNIQVLIDANIPHISCYALTVEAGTVLNHRVLKGKSPAPDDGQSNDQYKILQEKMKAAGYEQYEVSNFSKPGFHSRHNTSYWSGAHYIGIGPAAHSYNRESRQWNIANNVKYILAIRNGQVPAEKEILTDIQRYNELVMTGIRTSNGIDTMRLQNLPLIYAQYFEKEIQPFVEQGKIRKSSAGNYVLDPDHYFFADGIAAALFYVV